MKLKKSPCLKPFIDFNTEKRKLATNEADIALYKLFNNSCFGHSMMNVRKHVNVELVNSKKLCAKPTFEAFKVFNTDLTAVHLKKATLVLNQPLYAGFSILDLSKVLMYDYRHNFIIPKNGKKARLCFTDTDSLCYHIETEDLYTDIGEDIELFDTSKYDKENTLFSPKTNANVLGKMKDELDGKIMEEIIGHQPKMYSMKYKIKVKKSSDNEEKEITVEIEKGRAKGITKSVRQKQLRHTLYKQCLSQKVQFRHQMNQIQSKSHLL